MLLLVTAVSSLGRGGVPVVNELVVAALKKRGRAFSVVSLHDSPDQPWVGDVDEPFCASGSRARFVLGALARRAHGRGSTIFVTHMNLVSVGAALKRATGGRLVLFLHGTECWKPLGRPTAWGVRACDLLVANSHFTLAEFRRQNPGLGDVPGRVCYLPSRALPANGGAAVPAAGRARRVLVVGRLWGRGLQKGQRQLIEVWPRVLESFPDAELCVVGDGEGRHALEQLARMRGASERVTFAGGVSDAELRNHYLSSAVYAMPSKGEGFGLVFAEAMESGLPCVASRFDAGSEVVVDGETGVLVDPDDLDQIYAAVARLLGDAELRRRMGDAGRRRARELFALERFDQALVECLYE